MRHPLENMGDISFHTCFPVVAEPRDGVVNDYAIWRRRTTENMLIEWDLNLIWLGAHEGVYCPSTPSLGKPVRGPQPRQALVSAPRQRGLG